MVPRHSYSNRLPRLFAALLFLFLALSVAFTGVGVQAQSGSSPANPYGVNVFLHKEVESWKIDKTLQMIAQANVPWIKQEFPWQEIEFKKGYFYDDKWQKSSWEKYDQIVNIAAKYNLTIIARIDHAPDWAKSTSGAGPLTSNKDLADFINAFLDHYAGKIKYVQVWNEPNLADEWVPGKAVDPAGYAAMLKTIYPLVKAAHPDAVILSAPMATTLEEPSARGNMNDIEYWSGMYAAGIKGNFDLASANAYGLDQPPDAAPGPKVLNFRRVELLRNVMVQNGDSNRSIWLDEYGWNASPDSLSDVEKNYWRHVTPQQQAQWTVQGVQYARQHWPWVGVISIWYFRQVGDVTPDTALYYFAMVNPDFSAQPIYDAVKADAMNYPGPSSQGGPTQAPPTVTANQPAATPTRSSQASPTSAVVTPTQTATTETATSTPTSTSTPSETATVAVTPTSAATTGATATATAFSAAQPTATAIVAGTGAGGSNVGLYIVGVVLIGAGLAALGVYFMRNRTPAPGVED